MAVVVIIGVVAAFLVNQQQGETARLAQGLEQTQVTANAERAAQEKVESEAPRQAEAEKKRNAEEEKRQQELVPAAKREAEAKRKVEEERLRVEAEAKVPDKLKGGWFDPTRVYH